MKELLKNKKIVIIGIVTFIFFGIFLQMNYSKDTYLLLSAPNYYYIKELFKDGNIIMGIVFSILKFIRIPSYIMYLISYVLAFVFTILSILELNKLIDKYVPNGLLSFILSIGLIINPFLVGLWLMMEKGICMLSIYAVIKAIKMFDDFLEKKDKNQKKLLKILIWLFISVISYSKVTNLFLVLGTLPILKYSRSRQQWIRNNIQAILLYGIPSFIGFLWMQIFRSSKVGGSLELWEKTKWMFQTLWSKFINGFGIYAKWFLPIMIVLGIAFGMYSIFLRKKKTHLHPYLSILYIVLATIITTIYPFYFQNRETMVMDIGYLYASGCFLGIIFVFLNKKAKNNVLQILIILLLLGEYVAFTNAGIDRFITNAREKDIAMQIDEKVTTYENTTHQTVEKIVVYRDDTEESDIIMSEETAIAMFSFYSKRKMELADQTQYIYDRYFSGKEWKRFNIEQVIVTNNILYWYVYES